MNWEGVIENKNNGGLGIRDQGKVNQALGAKLVWRMIAGGKEWWIEAIRRKYIKRKKSRILDLPWGGKGTSIWNQLKNSAGLIKYKIYWFLGNGSKINIWIDSILGRPNLSSKAEFLPLCRWLEDHGYKSLKDFAIWGSRGDWKGLIRLNPPSHLDPLYAPLTLFYMEFPLLTSVKKI